MTLAEASEPGALIDVPISPLSPTIFAGSADAEQYERFIAAADLARERFRGRVVWNVNSTPQGGGVAEMLRPLLGYVRGAGIDTQWVVLRGDPAFFRLTKRLHNHLHGDPGDGGPLGPAEQTAYRAAMEPNIAALIPRLHPEDIVILHDPQTAGLVGAVRAAGARVVWRCHVGVDEPNEVTRNAREFLAGVLASADRYVFSREAHVWDVLDRARVTIIQPSIDAFAPKNYELDPAAVLSILAAAGVVSHHTRGLPPDFARADGSPGRVDRKARLVGGRIPREAPLVVQVSRWDRLKDPLGVLEGFVEHVAPLRPDAHLALVGPEVVGVSDDPEGAIVLADVSERWHRLPASMRTRVHVVSLPMGDLDLNAVMVNAIQRHATVVVQKSLAEGFGLTVAEAMWKRRPVVAGRVGGIQDQVDTGDSGILVGPRDLTAYGEAVAWLLSDQAAAAAMGERAHLRVQRQFLGPRHLVQYFDLLSRL